MKPANAGLEGSPRGADAEVCVLENQDGGAKYSGSRLMNPIQLPRTQEAGL